MSLNFLLNMWICIIFLLRFSDICNCLEERTKEIPDNIYVLTMESFFCSKFCIRREFLENPSLLRKRLKIVGIGMFLISPCLVIFMLVYLFLRHAEQFYHHPSTASSRRWSNLSKWIFREFNEVLALNDSYWRFICIDLDYLEILILNCLAG